MNAEADKRDLAAEYVLGTLDTAERDEVERLIQSDADLAALVNDWERKLGELSAMVEPVNPPAELWMAIQGRLAEITPTAPVQLPEFLQMPPAVENADAAFAGDVAVGAEAAEAVEVEAAEAKAAESEAPVAEDKAGAAEAAEASGTEAAMVTTDAADSADAAVAAEATGTPPAPGEIAAAREADVIDLTRRLRRWRGGAAVLGALAAASAAIIVTAALAPGYLPEPLRPPPEVRTVEVPREVVRTVEVPAQAPGRFVAVLQSSATAPAFIITVDVAGRNLTVRRVAAENQTDRSYELWLVSDRFQQPRSLGLIGTSEFTRAPTLTHYDPDTISNATFAVSLEPEGGSPTGQPTGPVLFSGKLVEAVPPSSPSTMP